MQDFAPWQRRAANASFYSFGARDASCPDLQRIDMNGGGEPRMDHGYRGASTTRHRRLTAEWSALRSHPAWRRLAALLALALLAAACASGAADDAADDTTDGQQPESSGAEIIR